MTRDPFDWDDSLLWPVDDEELIKAVLNRRAPVGGYPVMPPPQWKGGQFIPAEVWQRERALAKEAVPGLLETFGQKMQIQRSLYEDVLSHPAPKTTPGQVRWLMKTTIRETYEQAFMLGKRASGNLFSITEDDKKAIRRTRFDEFKYLRNFMHDMEAGGGVMDYAKRMDYYVKAARELYWLGFVRGDMSAERMISWVLGPTEHCASCLNAEAGSPYTAQAFWTKLARKQILPQSGALDCIGYHCQCKLIDSRPEDEALRRGKLRRIAKE